MGDQHASVRHPATGDRVYMTISALRTIAIASASIHEAYPPSPMLRWPSAGPDEVLDYSVDVTAPLNEIGASLVSVSVAIAPSGSGELSARTLSVSGTVITVWLAGGVAGRRYRIKIAAITQSDEFEWLIGLRIDPWNATFPTPEPPSTNFGTPITWHS